jgi:Cu(I)/Ag(I) efflux system membrane fusion protein
VVLVRLSEGRFEPRAVTVGLRGDDYAEVLTGVAEGEQVVTSANFLIDAESNLKAALSGLGEHAIPPAAEEHAEHAAPAQPAHKTIGHVAQGILEAVHDDGTVSITHEPIKSLGWPGMTMDFTLANTALVKDIPPGSAIRFEIVERKPDEWVITKMSVRASQEGSHAEHRH